MQVLVSVLLDASCLKWDNNAVPVDICVLYRHVHSGLCIVMKSVSVKITGDAVTDVKTIKNGLSDINQNTISDMLIHFPYQSSSKIFSFTATLRNFE